jgi:hypothetical protein
MHSKQAGGASVRFLQKGQTGEVTMNPEMRHELAKLPFEKNIEMAGQLLQLGRELKKARSLSPEDFYRCAKCGRLVGHARTAGRDYIASAVQTAS